MQDQSTIAVIALALITGLPAILLALARLIDVLRNNKRFAQLEREINGRMDQLLCERELRGRLEGLQEGRQARRHDDPPEPLTGQKTSLPPG